MTPARHADAVARQPLLAIIADDLTGALDAAAPFAARGLRVVVALGPEYLPGALAQGGDVIAVTTASREIPAPAARDAVRRAIGALPPVRILKKIDSRLKGNIAAELDALDHRRALMAPAIPEFGRLAQAGQVTGFGLDRPIDMRAALGRHAARATIPDTLDMAQMQAALAHSDADLLIGARGLAEALATSLTGREPELLSSLPGPCGLFVIGSRDPITVRQAERLRDMPGTVFAPAPNGHPKAPLPSARLTLLQALPDAVPLSGKEVAGNLANAVAPILRPGFGSALLCGGATAEAVLARLGVRHLHIRGECLPGLVVSATDSLTILTKSGGFGAEDSLVHVAKLMGGGAG